MGWGVVGVYGCASKVCARSFSHENTLLNWERTPSPPPINFIIYLVTGGGNPPIINQPWHLALALSLRQAFSLSMHWPSCRIQLPVYNLVHPRYQGFCQRWAGLARMQMATAHPMTASRARSLRLSMPFVPSCDVRSTEFARPLHILHQIFCTYLCVCVCVCVCLSVSVSVCARGGEGHGGILVSRATYD